MDEISQGIFKTAMELARVSSELVLLLADYSLF